MTESSPNTNDSPVPDGTVSDDAAIAAWLDAALPVPPRARDELPTLLAGLTALRSGQVVPARRGALLDRLYERVIRFTEAQLPALTERSLPIPVPRKTRPLVRELQEVLLALADVLLSAVTADDTRADIGTILWRQVLVLGQHLLLGHLAGSPAGKGAWQQLHQAYATAARLGLVQTQAGDPACSLHKVYFSAVLLGCAQPASFTSQEIDFVVACLERAVGQIDCTRAIDPGDPATFWIDATRDAPAIPWSRKPAPPDTEVRVFSGAPVADALREMLAGIETGTAPDGLGLPVFAASAAGRGVLRRLVGYWGAPGKRRFSRRHQNDRGLLCAGLPSLWRLFREGSGAPVKTSSWMIVNQSPDGCAVRHVSGKTGELAVGDIAAIRAATRTESADGEVWQICIVRWALSENQEHLELGLQILSPRALPAILAQPAKSGEGARLPVLILPEIKGLRADEWLVAPAGELTTPAHASGTADSFVLVVEKENIEVREAKKTRLEEQNGLIEIFAIERVNHSA